MPPEFSPNGDCKLGEKFDRFLVDRRPSIHMGKGDLAKHFRRFHAALVASLNDMQDGDQNWEWAFYDYRQRNCPELLKPQKSISILVHALKEDLHEFFAARAKGIDLSAPTVPVPPVLPPPANEEHPVMQGDGDGI